MSFLRRNIGVILVCLLEALTGVLLLINPTGFTQLIVTVVGVSLIIGGIASIVGYFRLDAVKASASGSLVKGLVMLLGGVALIFGAGWVTDHVVDFIFRVYGVVVLLGGLVKFQWFVDAIRLKTGRWAVHLLNAIISIGCALVLILNPFAKEIMWMFTGISLVVEAVMDLAVLIFAKGVGSPLDPPVR